MMQEENIDEGALRELRAVNREICWRAVRDRDARFDGTFVYGVRSTGIYCRPSCPSRRPGREQAVFFDSCEAAESGGFRACLRCAPRGAAPPDPGVDLVLRACRLIEAGDGTPPSLDSLGGELGVSPHHLQRTFRAVTGITPRQYAAALRLRQFKSRIRDGDDVTTAMYEAGFGSSSRLYEKSSERLGMTPATYRRGGKGMSISYTTTVCHLGRLLLAATDRGICAVSLGDTDEELAAALASEYPAADVRPGGAELSAWADELLRRLEGARPRAELPLDLQATAFQSRVWEELRRIPYGETRSYGDVAKAIGRPTATRAVARACATNPLALLTPCHRVVREGGELGGYRWGVGRKRELLRLERERAAGGDSKGGGRSAGLPFAEAAANLLDD